MFKLIVQGIELRDAFEEGENNKRTLNFNLKIESYFSFSTKLLFTMLLHINVS